MIDSPLTHRDVITALGGPHALARELGLNAQATTVHWRQPGRGIPARFWLDVEEVARRVNVLWITAALLRDTAPARKQRTSQDRTDDD